MDWTGIVYACALTVVIGIAYVLYDALVAARYERLTVVHRPAEVPRAKRAPRRLDRAA